MGRNPFLLGIVGGLCSALLFCTCFYWGGGGLLRSLPPAPKVARSSGEAQKNVVVNTNQVKERASAYLKLQEAVEKLNQILHQKILARETALRTMQERLSKLEKSSQASRKELVEKKQAFDKDVEAFGQWVDQNKESLQKYIHEASTVIDENFKAVLADIASLHNVDFILNSSGIQDDLILYNREEMDVTLEVIALLNKKLPEITLAPFSITPIKTLEQKEK